MHDVIPILGPSAAHSQRNRIPRLPSPQGDGAGAALRADTHPKHVQGEIPGVAPASGGSSLSMTAHAIPLAAADLFPNP